MAKAVKVNSNLWNGKFKIEEMRIYDGLTEKEINTVLEYQKVLPCLQDENDKGYINARTLHEQLKVGKVFANWIKERISKYEFDNGIDYKTVIAKSGKNSKGGRPSKEYQLSLDMAKELSMIENNDIGRTSRKYFIAIDKAFKYRSQWNKGRQASIDTF
ncbi:MAG: toxin-antitoxin system, toxin component, Bro domain protein, partial [Haloplasmataceae bacterium]|nr:toxin-antitoxin system, toxin component, Bro domain protein [Haloplasmataceae bacterium]